MNLYAQYLALLQMFFHRQDARISRHEKHANEMLSVNEDELFRKAA
jgi:hypothetical protein